MRTVVVGAGVIGLACAYALRQRGEDVVVLDQGEPGAACSRGNTGWVVPSFSKPLPEPGLVWQSLKWMLRANSPLFIAPRAALRLSPWLWRFWRYCNQTDYANGVAALADANAITMDLFDAWAADGIRFEMHRVGVLNAFLSERAQQASLAAFQPLIKCGYPAPRPLVGRELHEFEPLLRPAVQGGLWFEHERHLRPESLISGLVERLRTLGVEIHRRAEVLGGKGRRGRLSAVRTIHSDVAADRFVIAAGAWSGLVARTLGARVPVQAGKGYSLTFSLPRQTELRRPILLAEPHVAVSPFDGAIRIGGTMELSGINERLDPRRIRAIKASLREYLDLPDAVREEGVEWTGMRPLTPDGLPLIGRLPQLENVYIATGHGMIGVTMAPVTGRLIAEMIVGNDSRMAAPFDPARFGQ